MASRDNGTAGDELQPASGTQGGGMDGRGPDNQSEGDNRSSGASGTLCDDIDMVTRAPTHKIGAAIARYR